MNHILEPHELNAFIFAGKSYFAIYSNISNNTLEYRVKTSPNGHVWWVTCKLVDEWVYLGYIRPGNMSHLAMDNKVGMTDDLKPRWVFQWILDLIYGKQQMRADVVFYHMGHCARCGRWLKDDLSVTRGFGPVCWKKRR